MSDNANMLGGLVMNQECLSVSWSVRESEDSTLVSHDVASRVSTDSTRGTANIQLH